MPLDTIVEEIDSNLNNDESSNKDLSTTRIHDTNQVDDNEIEAIYNKLKVLQTMNNEGLLSNEEYYTKRTELMSKL